MTELLFTTKDVADMLQVDKSPVKRWAHDGKQVYFWKTGAQEVRRGRSALLEGKMDEVKGMN